MSVSKREFIDVRMQMEYYESLEREQRDNMDVRLVEVEGWKEEYEKDEAWQGLKTRSNKAYKDLKKREFEIRNK